MRDLRNFYKLMLLSVFSIFAKNSYAACIYTSYQIPVPKFVYSVSDSAYPQMLSTSWHYSGMKEAYRCGTADVSWGAPFFGLANNQIPSTGKSMVYGGLTYEIYDSGVKGVGVIMTAQDSSARYAPFTSTELKIITGTTPAVSTGYPLVKSAQFAIRYVLTERPSPGIITIPALTVMRQGLNVRGTYYGWGMITTPASSAEISYQGCSVQTPGTIALPRMDVSFIQAPGSYSSAVPFNLTVNCFPGVNSSYTLTDINNPANRSAILSLSAADTSAKGVSFQVTDTSEAVNFGPESSSQGSLNQRSFGIIPESGTLTKSFGVRYVRTEGPVVPGVMRAGVTITMSYK